MVFQNYALFPHMTVAENLSFPLEVRNMGKSEREAKVKRALDMVEMGVSVVAVPHSFLADAAADRIGACIGV